MALIKPELTERDGGIKRGEEERGKEEEEEEYQEQITEIADQFMPFRLSISK